MPEVRSGAGRTRTLVRRFGRFPAAPRRNTLASTSKLQPLGDRVVVKPTPREEMTKSGIDLPDTAKEKPQEGMILAVVA